MKNEILIKLKELHDLIVKEDISEEECLIIGDFPNETNLIGTKNSYLNFIDSVIKIILFSEKIIARYDDLFIDGDDLSSSELKKAISEYSDFWIVNMELQGENKFREMLKDQYNKIAGSHK